MGPEIVNFTYKYFTLDSYPGAKEFHWNHLKCHRTRRGYLGGIEWVIRMMSHCHENPTEN